MASKEYQHEWYIRNKKKKEFVKKRKENHRKWVLRNRDKVSNIQTRYYNKNKKLICKKMRLNVINKLKAYERNKKRLKKCPWLSNFYAAKTRCNNKNNPQYKNYGGRGIKFLLTIEEIKELWFRDKAHELKKPSIDRKDNNWHYEFSNCRFIEFVDNIKKSNYERHNKGCLDYSI